MVELLLLAEEVVGVSDLDAGVEKRLRVVDLGDVTAVVAVEQVSRVVVVDALALAASGCHQQHRH